MNTLIVGLDFSKGSMYALMLAIDVANRCGYDIKIVWVDSKKERAEDITQRLEDVVKEHQPKLKETKLSFIKRHGKPFHEIIAQAEEDKAELIVVGSHGSSGYKKEKIGSNAFKIMENTPCPVLIIREDFNFDKKLDKIILPLDSSEATRQKVPYAANMAKIFGSGVFVLGIYTSKMDAIRKSVNRYVSQTKDFLAKEGVPCNVEFLDAENLTTATLSYAESIQADLIIIMTEQEKTLMNIFIGSFASQMINTSPIPVLGIPPSEINGSAR